MKQESLPFEHVIFSRLHYYTQVRLEPNVFALCSAFGAFARQGFVADCLNMLDETAMPGSAAASDAYCNRALVLMQQQLPDNPGALQDSSCAVVCNQANCKVNNGHVKDVLHLHYTGVSRAHHNSCNSRMTMFLLLSLLRVCGSASVAVNVTAVCANRHGTAEHAVTRLCRTIQQHVMMLTWQSSCPGQPVLPVCPATITHVHAHSHGSSHGDQQQPLTLEHSSRLCDDHPGAS